MIKRHPNVTKFIDRHGKTRWRFRRSGQRTHYFKSEPGTREFDAEWQAASAGMTLGRPTKGPCPYGDRPYVYFIGADEGPVKIGSSSTLALRLISIQCGNPYPLKILAVRPGTTQITEFNYHRRFAKHRLRGEWFERAPAIVREMDRLRTVNGHPPGFEMDNPPQPTENAQLNSDGGGQRGSPTTERFQRLAVANRGKRAL
jgi:hypothetical protein